MSNEAINNAKSWEIAQIYKGDKATSLVFSPDVEITVGGRKLDLGLDKDGNPNKRLTLFINDPVETLQYKADNGYITPKQLTENIEFVTKFNQKGLVRAKLV